MADVNENRLRAKQTKRFHFNVHEECKICYLDTAKFVLVWLATFIKIVFTQYFCIWVFCVMHLSITAPDWPPAIKNSSSQIGPDEPEKLPISRFDLDELVPTNHGPQYCGPKGCVSATILTEPKSPHLTDIFSHNSQFLWDEWQNW